jgi:hypothetical protein
MDTSDDVNILKIIFEEEDDDEVSLLYLSEEKIKGHDQLDGVCAKGFVQIFHFSYYTLILYAILRRVYSYHWFEQM